MYTATVESSSVAPSSAALSSAALSSATPSSGTPSVRDLVWVLACLSVLWPVAVGNASTLQHNPDAPGYVHEIFGVEDGLPSAGLTHVLQTSDGYLWIATFDGLVRYDGARFVISSGPTNIPSCAAIGSAICWRIAIETLWILVDQSYLVRYREGRFSACGPVAGGLSCALSDSDARDFVLHEDPGGAIWIVWEGQVFRVDSESPIPQKICHLPFADLAVEMVSDLQGRLWIVTADRLWLGRWKPHGKSEFVQVDRGIKDLGVDEQGTVWVSRETEVGHLTDEGYTTVQGDFGASIEEDPRGGLWVSTSDRRLYRVVGGEWVLIAQESEHFGLGILDRRSLLASPDGSSWMAWRRFLLRDGATVWTIEQDLSYMSSVTLDRQGTVWATGISTGELHAFHPRRLETLVDGMPSTATSPGVRG